jgi:hypothetical protein
VNAPETIKIGSVTLFGGNFSRVYCDCGWVSHWYLSDDVQIEGPKHPDDGAAKALAAIQRDTDEHFREAHPDYATLTFWPLPRCPTS